MGGFGHRAKCPECGRTIGVLPGGRANTWVIMYHRDDGAPCPGKGTVVSEAASHERPDVKGEGARA